MAKDITATNDDTFEDDVLKSELPVMVDFWAPWCGPCRAIGPIVEDLQTAYGAKMKFVKLNVDESPITPSKYNVKAIPTLIFIKNGKIQDQITGMVAKGKIEAAIKGLV